MKDISEKNLNRLLLVIIILLFLVLIITLPEMLRELRIIK